MPLDPLEMLQAAMQTGVAQAPTDARTPPFQPMIDKAQQEKEARIQQALQMVTMGGGGAAPAQPVQPAPGPMGQPQQDNDASSPTRTALDGFLLTGKGGSPVETAVRERMAAAGYTGKKGVAKQFLVDFLGGLAMGPKYVNKRQQIVNDVMKEMQSAQQTVQAMTQAQRAEDLAKKYQGDLEYKDRQLKALTEDRNRKAFLSARKMIGDEDQRDYMNARAEHQFEVSMGMKRDQLELAQDTLAFKRKAYQSGLMKDPGTAAYADTQVDFFDKYGVAPEKATPEQRQDYQNMLKENVKTWVKLMDEPLKGAAPKERVAFVKLGDEVLDEATGRRGPAMDIYRVRGGEVEKVERVHIDAISKQASQQIEENYKSAGQARELAVKLDADIKSNKASGYMGIIKGSQIGQDLMRAGVWGSNVSPDAIESGLRTGQLTMSMTRAFTGAQATDNERKYISRLVPQLWNNPAVARELAWSLGIMNELQAIRQNKRIRPGDNNDVSLVDVMPLFYAKWVKDGKMYTAQDMIDYVKKKKGL